MRYKIITGIIITALVFGIGSLIFSPSDNNNNDYYEPSYSNNNHNSSSGYHSHCWRCGDSIDSGYDKKCYHCGGYICSRCGACFCDY